MYANKMDLPNAASINEIQTALNLDTVLSRAFSSVQINSPTNRYD